MSTRENIRLIARTPFIIKEIHCVDESRVDPNQLASSARLSGSTLFLQESV